jgi:hypothetical protein
LTTRLQLTPAFEKAFVRLPKALQARVTATLERFIDNPRHPGLHFEKLRGGGDLHSIRTTRGYRILMRRESDSAGELFALVDVGPHDITADGYDSTSRRCRQTRGGLVRARFTAWRLGRPLQTSRAP